MYCSPVIYNEDGLERLKQGGWDHIITDPDYDNQPPVAPYRAHCKGNILNFCDARKRPEDSGEPDEVLFWIFDKFVSSFKFLKKSFYETL